MRITKVSLERGRKTKLIVERALAVPHVTSEELAVLLNARSPSVRDYINTLVDASILTFYEGPRPERMHSNTIPYTIADVAKAEAYMKTNGLLPFRVARPIPNRENRRKASSSPVREFNDPMSMGLFGKRVTTD